MISSQPLMEHMQLAVPPARFALLLERGVVSGRRSCGCDL
jgi:hypothetical protein